MFQTKEIGFGVLDFLRLNFIRVSFVSDFGFSILGFVSVRGVASLSLESLRG